MFPARPFMLASKKAAVEESWCARTGAIYDIGQPVSAYDRKYTSRSC
jgi:hypothetical protein